MDNVFVSLRTLLEHLDGLNPASVRQVFANIEQESAQSNPDKQRIGATLEQVLEDAKELETFSKIIDKIEPLVEHAVLWLGEDWRHIQNLLRSKELGQKFPVELETYNPQWEILYREEAQFLLAQLGPGVILRTEHFGSTAVPGLTAKPVIDMLVEIPSFEIARQTIVPRLEALGYRHFWRSDSPPGHLMLIKGYGPHGYLDGVPRYHLHLAPGDHPLWERLLFRDYVRKYPEAARQYVELKAQLAERFRYDREAYTHGKTEFIQHIMQAARAEREHDTLHMDI